MVPLPSEIWLLIGSPCAIVMLLPDSVMLWLTGTSLSLVFCGLVSFSSSASLQNGKNIPSPYKTFLATPVSKRDIAKQSTLGVFSTMLNQASSSSETAKMKHMEQREFVAGTDNTSLPNSKQDARNRSLESAWYDTTGWLPKKGFYTDRKVNLAVLPMLAFIIFIFGVCVKCYSWMRDQDRRKARGTLDFEDDEQNYTIITEGEHGYREVDFRSDTTSMYDTLTSFRSMRLPCNENTITSVKSLPNQPFESYRSILIQRLEGGVYASVQSYKAFLQKSIEAKDIDIEVELVKNYTPCRSRSKSYDAVTGAAARSRRRRMRQHSGSRSMNGSVGAQAAKERIRRHSEKTPSHCSHLESLRKNTFHRQSSPAIFEPLLEGAICISLEQSDTTAGAVCPNDDVFLERRPSSSSSSSNSFHSNTYNIHSNTVFSKVSTHKRRERPRVKRASHDMLTDHSSGHSSDESPKSSSSSSDSNSSNEVDSDSDVTDSGLVVEPSPLLAAKGEPDKQQANGNILSRAASRKVHRFKVSFVDDGTLDTSSSDVGGKWTFQDFMWSQVHWTLTDEKLRQYSPLTCSNMFHNKLEYSLLFYSLSSSSTHLFWCFL